MSTLSILSKAVAFSDTNTTTSNPLRRNFDWTRSLSLSVASPKGDQQDIPAGGSWTFFNNVRSTTVDGTTAFTVTTNPNDSARYRFSFVSGTNPTLRTDRSLTLSGAAVTVAIAANATATLTTGSGTFGSTAAGDTIFIPGVSTGDSAGPFNVLNEGYWVVLAVLSSTAIQVARPTGTAFQGTAEVQTLTQNAQLQAFSAAGVQIGDQVAISAGFSPSTQKTFTVEAVTSKFFEVESSTAIPLETAIEPGAAGIQFYNGAKRFLRVEADQLCSIRLNGATNDLLQIQPSQAGDPDQMGWQELMGPVWSLVVVNKSSQTTTVNALSAE